MCLQNPWTQFERYEEGSPKLVRTSPGVMMMALCDQGHLFGALPAVASAK
jgi:hypothetical protein